jgi:hypothetical protein
MSGANWYPDPTGRHAQRYFDGDRWTAHVAAGDGTQQQDPTPVDPSVPPPGPPAPPAPPAASTPGAYPPPGAAPDPHGWQAPAGATPSSSPAVGPSNIAVGPPLIVSGIGAVLTLLAMVALPWFTARGESVDRSEMSDALSIYNAAIDEVGDLARIMGESIPSTNMLTDMFFSWGWVLVLVATIASVVATAAVPALRRPIAIACGVAAAWTLFAAVDGRAFLDELATFDATFGDRISLGFGAWLAVLGPIAGLVGAVLPRSDA